MKNKLFIFLLLLLLVLPQYGFAQKSILISIPLRTLELHKDGKFVKQYPIAVGKPSYDSPLGHYSVRNKAVNPVWRPKGKKPVYPGPDNPLGTRWIGFYGEYGIHGNNNPKSIGTFASKGCIRMYNYDVEELYNLVDVGTDVDIYYNTIHKYDNSDKNKAALIVYPDLYNKKVNGVDTINQRLDELGIKNIIDSKKLENLYKSINKGTTIFTKNWSVFINGEYFSADTRIKNTEDKENSEEELKEQKVLFDDTAEGAKTTEEPVIDDKKESKMTTVSPENVLVNLYNVNTFFGLNLKVNKDNKIIFDNREIYHEIIDNIPYVSVLDCVRTIEGYYNIDMTQEKINWIITYGKMDNKFFRLDLKSDANNIYASVRDIVNVLGLSGEWDGAKRAFVINGVDIKGKIIGGRMYITPQEIKKFLGLNAEFFSVQNKLVLKK